jgi:phosphohistidine phosphatase
MHHLFLLRHADAPRKQSETDADRVLSSHGYIEAEKTAQFLNRYKIDISNIASSDSIRTRQTVGKIMESYAYHPNIRFLNNLYNASGHEILEYITSQDGSVKNLMVVGHNPGITTVLDLINPKGSSSDIIRSKNFEVTCKIVCIEGNFDSWSEINETNTRITQVFYPSDAI